MSHGRDTSPKPYGVVAEFDTPEALLSAARKARDAGYRDIDAYSPMPVHGLADAIGFKDDRLGWMTFMAGLAGATGGMGMEWWVSTIAYPHNVGGKPMFSLPMFVPVAYECTILLASFGAFFGMLMLNRMPTPHQPIFNAKAMTRASQDRYVMCIEATDPNYEESAVTKFLNSLKPLSVEAIKTSEGY